jgi:ubiquinone/menaquinone biosynthesis C-methylase UbiE
MEGNGSMAWYDVFANFYDVSLDGAYREHRRQALEALQIVPGMTVVDVGCGTGASFPLLVDAVTPKGRVVGIDASIGMRTKAEWRTRRNGWRNVQLLDVRELAAEPQQLTAQCGPIDRVLCFLSLSVIPDWEAVLDRWFSALAPGGRLVVADVHNASPGLYARVVELISRANLRRASWEPLQARCSDFKLERQPSSWLLGGQFFVASGGRSAA